MAKKPKRDRTVRREAARAAAALGADRERLFALEPGGAAGRPIDVDAVPVVELRAISVACPRCAGRHRVEEHAAVTVAGARLHSMWVSTVPLVSAANAQLKGVDADGGTSSGGL